MSRWTANSAAFQLSKRSDAFTNYCLKVRWQLTV